MAPAAGLADDVALEVALTLALALADEGAWLGEAGVLPVAVIAVLLGVPELCVAGRGLFVRNGIIA